MTDRIPDLGTYLEIDGRPAIRFVRHLPHAPERVWNAVTEPAEMAAWFPSAVVREPRTGGEIAFRDDPHTEPTTGTVLVWEPPVRFAFTWGGDELHLELAPGPDGGCALTLTNVLEARDTAARNGAGWAVCLDELAASLDGRGSGGPHSEQALPWRPVYDAHVAAGVPSGARVPG